MKVKREIGKELMKWRYAHRGLHKKPKIPENSMTAFKRAVEEGFGIELDLHLTKDGKLAVIHDSSLKRTCGVDLLIEEITLEEAQSYFLEESKESIIEFKELLKVVDGKIPLLIELKAVGRTYKGLVEETMRSLEGYKGLYCIESFNPYVINYLRKQYPQVVRGQLAADLLRDEKGNRISLDEVSRPKNWLLKNLWINILGKPDFVAYKFENRNQPAFQRYSGGKFLWTIRKYEDMVQCEKLGMTPIFEQFNPKEKD